MQTSRLGATGPHVSAIGLGGMGISGVYGPADRAESIATINCAPRRDRLTGALDRDLGPADLAAIEAAVPKDAAAGTRYAAAQMAHLDSEAAPG